MSSILPTDVQLFLSGEPKADARGECYREPGSTIPIIEPLNLTRSLSMSSLTLIKIGKQMTVRNNLTLLVLHKSLPCSLIGRIPSDCRKQCK